MPLVMPKVVKAAFASSHKTHPFGSRTKKSSYHCYECFCLFFLLTKRVLVGFKQKNKAFRRLNGTFLKKQGKETFKVTKNIHCFKYFLKVRILESKALINSWSKELKLIPKTSFLLPKSSELDLFQKIHERGCVELEKFRTKLSDKQCTWSLSHRPAGIYERPSITFHPAAVVGSFAVGNSLRFSPCSGHFVSHVLEMHLLSMQLGSVQAWKRLLSIHENMKGGLLACLCSNANSNFSSSTAAADVVAFTSVLPGVTWMTFPINLALDSIIATNGNFPERSNLLSYAKLAQRKFHLSRS